VRGAMGPAYCLRHRMLHFLQNFVYYMTLEVIGPRGHELESLLDGAEDLDEVMELHEKFLDTCLKECLLANQELLKILTKLMTTCLLFADQMQRFSVDETGGGSVGVRETREARERERANNSSGATTAVGAAAPLRRSLKSIGGNELTTSLQLRQSKLRESADFILQETSHDSFVRVLNKFGDTFDAQVFSLNIFLYQ
jgi:hypothetical protein